MLVVYGYHWYEKFAVDVGMDLVHTRESDFKVVPYTGKPDFPNRVDERYQKPAFPNFWKFAKQFSPSYVVDLHSGVASRAEKLGPAIDVDFYTKRKKESIEPSFRERVTKFVYGNDFRTSLHFSPRFPYVPASISQIVVEFLPPRIARKEAREFVLGLIRVL